MRILFTSSAIPTHLLMFAPLVWACRAAGHEVRVASMPALTPTTVAAGLPAVEVSEDYDILADIVQARGGQRVETSVSQWSRSGLARPGSKSDTAVAEWRAGVQRKIRNQMFNPWVRPAEVMVPGLLRFAERWRPHLMVTDPLVFAASVVSATLGIPLVRFIWGPDMMRQIGYPLQGQPAGPEEAREQWPAELVELFDRFGVEARNDHAATTLDPWPGSLQLPGTPGRVPMRFVPYNGAAVVPDWVVERPSRPRVCVTWGTSNSALGGEQAYVLPRVVKALAPLDIEVVLAVSAADRANLGEIPENVRIAERLPLHLVMPTCDAIVNQAGASSLLTAASYGVPQVLVPQTADTPFTAANFSASGAAVVLDVTEADTDTDTIGSAVTTALTDEAIRTAALKIRDEITLAPSLTAVVDTLPSMAAGDRLSVG